MILLTAIVFFKRKFPGRYLVLDVSYSLSEEHSLKLNYAALKTALESKKNRAGHDSSGCQYDFPNQEQQIARPRNIGQCRQFSKNPVISRDHFLDLKTKFPDLVAYKLNERYYKLPAAWIIEKKLAGREKQSERLGFTSSKPWLL